MLWLLCWMLLLFIFLLLHIAWCQANVPWSFQSQCTGIVLQPHTHTQTPLIWTKSPFPIDVIRLNLILIYSNSMHFFPLLVARAHLFLPCPSSRLSVFASISNVTHLKIAKRAASFSGKRPLSFSFSCVYVSMWCMCTDYYIAYHELMHEFARISRLFPRAVEVGH